MKNLDVYCLQYSEDVSERNRLDTGWTSIEKYFVTDIRIDTLLILRDFYFYLGSYRVVNMTHTKTETTHRRLQYCRNIDIEVINTVITDFAAQSAFAVIFKCRDTLCIMMYPKNIEILFLIKAWLLLFLTFVALNCDSVY